jgi:uncharacterized protein YcbX
MRLMVRVRSLHVYPVKGARGVALDRAEVLRGGLRHGSWHDRRFMVVAEDGSAVARGLTQREHPRLALVDVRIVRIGPAHHTTLRVVAGADSVDVDLGQVGQVGQVGHVAEVAQVGRPRRRVRIFDNEVEAVDAGRAAGELFSAWLGTACSLVFMPDDVIRPVEAPYGQEGDRVGFADAYPVLFASLASLDALNERLAARGSPPVPMDRFRPNIVVEGAEPWAEDRAEAIRVGAVTFRTPKRCARCQVTTVDQTTGEVGKEPLRTLASFRTEANKVYFATNGIPQLSEDRSESVTVAVGDEVELVEAVS